MLSTGGLLRDAEPVVDSFPDVDESGQGRFLFDGESEGAEGVGVVENAAGVGEGAGVAGEGDA